MTDDPWAQFPSSPPGESSSAADPNDPWSKFSRSAPSAAKAEQPLDTTWSQWLPDFARRATNPFGLGDLARAGMQYIGGGDVDLAQQRLVSKQAGERLGPWGTFAGDVTSTLPLQLIPGLGQLGTGEALGGLLGGSALARGVGILGEGAGLGAVNAAGRGENIGQGMIGGAVGGAVGAGAGRIVGGAVNAGLDTGLGRALTRVGADVDPAVITAQTEADKQALYGGLGDIKWNSGPVSKRLTAGDVALADRDSTGTLLNNAPEAMNAWNSFKKQAQTFPTQSGDSVATALQNLNNAGSMGGKNAVVASVLRPHLEGIMDNLPPSQNPLGQNALDLFTRANAANKQFESASALQSMAENYKNYGTSPAGAAKTQAGYYPSSDPANQSINQGWQDIANAGQPGPISSWMLGHAGGRLAEMGAAGIGLAGHPLGWVGLAGLIGAKAAASSYAKRKAAQQILDSIASQYPGATGQVMHHPSLNFTFSPATRALMMGGAMTGSQQGQ
jgi:hypothetical protein